MIKFLFTPPMKLEQQTVFWNVSI